MKVFAKGVAAILAASFVVSCASTTVIDSVPSGAKVFLDGAPVGQTPYTHTDKALAFSSTQIKLKKDGCEDFSGVIKKDGEFQVGPCIGGVFALFPFLWIMGYNPRYQFEMECKGAPASKK